MFEIYNSKIQQLNILLHKYNLDKEFQTTYSPYKLEIIITTLKNSQYYNNKTKIVDINSIQLQELFNNKNIKQHEILVTIGRNKIPYKKHSIRHKKNNHQYTQFSIYKILLH